jgi:hypothetical protein
MLKLRLNIRDGTDITKFLKLVPFLKRKVSWLSGEKVKGIDTRPDQFIFRKS